MTYEFTSQLSIGKQGERALDNYFSEQFNIIEATLEEEKAEGFDRLFNPHDYQSSVRRIEYKTCSWSVKTGNIALEVISNDKTGKLGWIHTTKADWIIYYAYGSGKAYWFRPEDVRAELYELMKKYRIIAATNKDYHSYNLLVPKDDFIKQFVKMTSLIPPPI